MRYAYPFDYQHEATTLLPNSDFLALSDHVTQYGPVRAQTLGLYIPDSIKEWLLSGAPRIYDRKDLELPGNRQIALPSILTRYFCSELTIQQFEALLIAKEADNDKELDVAATACRKMKRAKQTLARLPHPDRILAVVVLLLQIVLVLLACILAPHQLSHPLPQGVRPPLLALLAQSMAALSKDQRKANPLLRSQWARAKAQPQAPKGMTPPRPKISLFSPLHRKQVRTLPQRGKKGKNKGKDKGKDKGGHKGKDKGGHKGKGKGKGKDYKG